MCVKSVQIFIVNYNATDEINKNIKLIFENNNVNTFEIKIIIVDNSNDFVLTQLSYKNFVTIIPQTNNVSGVSHGKGSLDHAQSLNMYVNNRAFSSCVNVILDPDCYVYGDAWITKLVGYLNDTHTCIATPWHPKHEAKKVGSIAPHFVMFKYDENKYYDFLPKFGSMSKIRMYTSSGNKLSKIKRFKALLRNIKRLIFWGTSYDTGFRLRDNFSSVIFLKPRVYEGQVSWINSKGKPKLLFKLFLFFMRGIVINADYKYVGSSAFVNEEFELDGITFYHERRTVKS